MDSPLGDRTCAFQSFDLSLLELAPDPGADSYRLSVELRQLIADGRDPDGVERIGLYFGCAEGSRNGRPAHLALSAVFNDIDRRTLGRTPNPQRVRAGTIGCFRRTTDDLLYKKHESYRSIPFTPVVLRPGLWRQIIADVTPRGVTVKWRGDDGKLATVADWTAADAARIFNDGKQELDKTEPGVAAVLPNWHPRRAFGVLCWMSAVAVRNVTLEPLP
jgi:hypothetical protein